MELKQLPARPSLEQYKKQAKELVKSRKSGDPETLRRIRQHHPQFGKLPEADFLNAKYALADAQLVIAREHGFESWPKFAKHIEAVNRDRSPVSQFEAAADAVVNGDLATLERLLREDPALVRAHSTREHRATLLHYVAANGVEDFRQKTPQNAVRVAELLLQAGAEVDAANMDYGLGTALGLVATSIHPWLAGVQNALLDTLLTHGASVDGLPGGWNPLIAALHNDRPEAAAFLAARGAHLDLEGASGVGRLEVVKSFFHDDGSLKPNATQAQLQAGFTWACEYGRKEVVEFLLDKGVELRAGENTDQTALHLAAHRGQLEIIKLLLERGAPLEAKNGYGGTVLGQATWSAVHGDRNIDFVPIIEMLLAAGAKIEEADFPTGNERVDEVLRRHGAQANAPAKPLPPHSSLEQYERLAMDFVAAYGEDAEALRRLNDQFPRTLNHEQLRELIQQRMSAISASESWTGDFTQGDAQLFVARQHGFESWAKFVESFAQPPGDPRSAALGQSITPPFYKIDWKKNSIEPGPLLSGKDWDTIFEVMKEHQITGINANGQMTDAALSRLPQLDFVTCLNMGGSKRVTDDGLLQLARMPQLQELDLSGWESQVTDRGLEALRHLPELRRFQMCWPQRVTDAGAANLAFCDHLESVDLMGTPTGDGAIRALTGKRNLRRFKTGKLVTDAGLPLLHQFPVFKTWQGGEIKYELMSADADPNHLLLDGPFTNNGLASIAGLNGLFALSFFWHISALTADGLKPLANLPNLGFLGCQGELCYDEAMRHIAAIPRLRMLMGQGTMASDDGFAALSRSQTIEYIWGRECPNLGGRGFAALAAMPALKGLAVSCKNVDDAALSALPRFPALRGLMPMDVSDDGFRHVGRCEQLEDLWCMYCRDTGDAATGHIAGLSKLKTYYAGKTKITDRSLEILGRMSSLEKLEFWECASITNAGIALLAGLPRLREISIGGSPNVTREGMVVFPAAVQANYW